MVVRARNYTLIDGILYKKGVVQPLLKCISQSEGKDLLQEIHLGSCGSHIGPRALSAKAIRQGFYCPTHIKDAEQIVKTCQACQSTSPHPSKPSTTVQLIHPTQLAPSKMGNGPGWATTTIARGNQFAVVAIEYFTRWIEAKPLTKITSKTVKKFFWHKVICRFEVLRTLTVDNGKQFDSDNFKEFCKSIGTKVAFA